MRSKEDGGVQIGALSALTGVSQRSLRHYEDAGLLAVRRTAGGWRDYVLDDVDRVITIQHLLAGGLTTAAIAELLPCVHAAPGERTGMLQERLAEEVERTRERLRELERQLSVLEELRDDGDLAPDQSSSVARARVASSSSSPSNPVA